MSDVPRTGENSYFNKRLRAILNSESRSLIQDLIWLTALDWYFGDMITTDNFHQLVGAALDRINELKICQKEGGNNNE